MNLDLKYQPLNLGRGFVDYPVPKFITDALISTASNSNCLLTQSTRGFVSTQSDIEINISCVAFETTCRDIPV